MNQSANQSISHPSESGKKTITSIIKKYSVLITCLITFTYILAIIIPLSLLQKTKSVSFHEVQPQKTPEKKVAGFNTLVFPEKKQEPPELTLEKIFNSEKNQNVITDQSINILVTGDVNLARSVNATIQSYNDPTYPFLKTQKLLQSGDLTLINLESPLVKDCPITNSGMIFCGNVENVKGLSFAGVDVASIANNHVNDQGVNGINQTKEVLEYSTIQSLEQGKVLFKNIKGKTLAFIAYDLVWHSENEAAIVENIRQASKNVDIMIAFFHWGSEYTSKPSESQRQIAHLVIDNGADLVVGNHPHWVQAVEIYKNHLIVYSHGNFIFDQLWSQETREGVVGSYTFSDNGYLIDTYFTPIFINDKFQPEMLVGEKAQKILDRMLTASNKIKEKIVLSP